MSEVEKKSKKIRKKTSNCWRFYTKNDRGGICKLCHKLILSNGNTTNLLNHMKRKHKIQWKAASEEVEEDRAESPDTLVEFTLLKNQEGESNELHRSTIDGHPQGYAYQSSDGKTVIWLHPDVQLDQLSSVFQPQIALIEHTYSCDNAEEITVEVSEDKKEENDITRMGEVTQKDDAMTSNEVVQKADSTDKGHSLVTFEMVLNNGEVIQQEGDTNIDNIAQIVTVSSSEDPSTEDNLVSSSPSKIVMAEVVPSEASKIMLDDVKTSSSKVILDNVETSSSKKILDNVETSSSKIILDNVETSSSKIILDNAETSSSKKILDKVKSSSAKKMLDNVKTSSSKKKHDKLKYRSSKKKHEDKVKSSSSKKMLDDIKVSSSKIKIDNIKTILPNVKLNNVTNTTSLPARTVVVTHSTPSFQSNTTQPGWIPIQMVGHPIPINGIVQNKSSVQSNINLLQDTGVYSRTNIIGKYDGQNNADILSGQSRAGNCGEQKSVHSCSEQKSSHRCSSCGKQNETKSRGMKRNREQSEDSFDYFGKYIATLLRNLPSKKSASRLQKEMLNWVLREQMLHED